MSSQGYYQSYEDAHYAILDAMPKAKHNHVDGQSPLGQLHAVVDKCTEVWSELKAGNHEKAMDGYKEVGAALYLAMEDLQQQAGAKIR